MKPMKKALVKLPVERVEKAIYLIRGEKVILDRDLAEMYGVETRVLKQAVRRNIERFPSDFMFVMSKSEFADWRSQFVTSDADRIGLRYAPMAFTEQGVAMLSSVLRSKRAIAVNVEIIRTFVRLRQLLASNADLAKRVDEMEKKFDGKFKIVFDAINKLFLPPGKPHGKIGFVSKTKKA